MSSLTREQVLLEYVKCQKDTPYAFRTYLQTYDQTASKFVPLELFTDQINLLKDYENFEENIALKYRQAGVSTVTAAWISKKLAFASKTKPEKILIIANKLDTAQEMANKIRAFVGQWPSWLGVDFSDEKNSQRHYKLNNGCEVKAVATSKDALRGYTPTILVFDEAAYIEADGDFWAACMASLSTGGKVIVVSTPNGFDPIYYDIYAQALKGMNQFKVSEMFWYRDPRYSKDLYFVETDDIVHFLLNREEYSQDRIKTFDYLEFDIGRDLRIKEMMSLGYKPSSPWYEKMVKKLKFDKRKINQELECQFLGSGDNVFDSNLMTKIHENMIKEPSNKMMSGSLWIWDEPVMGHKYVMGIDASRGDSEDFSSFQIIDFDERKQVCEYLGKVPPDILAEICFKWGNMYNAFAVIDITGGMGVATSRKMQELGYRSLYVDGIDYMNKWKWDPKSIEKIPGINFNSKRVQIIAAYEEALRHGFTVRSNRLYNEMNTFIYINGRPDHQKGQHDDLIMAISMACYVAEASFTNLTKVTEQTKSMIDAWTVQTNDNYQKQSNFNPVVPNHSAKSKDSIYSNNPTKNDYQNYLWLFGGKR
jgi:hypothetical protein